MGAGCSTAAPDLATSPPKQRVVVQRRDSGTPAAAAQAVRNASPGRSHDAVHRRAVSEVVTDVTKTAHPESVDHRRSASEATGIDSSMAAFLRHDPVPPTPHVHVAPHLHHRRSSPLIGTAASTNDAHPGAGVNGLQRALAADLSAVEDGDAVARVMTGNDSDASVDHRWTQLRTSMQRIVPGKRTLQRAATIMGQGSHVLCVG